VRSFGDVFPLYLRRNVEASRRRLRGRGARTSVRVVFASSSSVYGAAERYPTPEDTPRAPLSPYGITKLAAEHLARAYARASARRVVAPLLQRLRPAAAPDMAFTRIALALAEGGRSRSTATARSRELDVRLRRRRRDDRGDGARRGTYNVGGALEASLRTRSTLFERLARSALDSAPSPRSRRPAADERRHDPHPRRARLAAARRLEDGLDAHWKWASARVGAR
jgi:nucleoside-diphosphate-sugar epimerase